MTASICDVRGAGQIVLIALYVDDVLIACSNASMLAETKRQLKSHFKMKDLGKARIILGMDITRDLRARTLSLCQSRYAQKWIDRFGLSSARGQSRPVDPAVDLTQVGPACVEPYREAIGSLMYVMVGTRPDLAFSIGVLAKHVQNPTKVCIATL